MYNRLLWELQDIDLQLAALAEEQERILQSLQEPEELLVLEREAYQLEEEYRALEGRIRDAELELQSLEEARRGLERRLYGGYITNPREVEAAEHKIQELHRRTEALEEQVLDMMAKSEDLQARLQMLRERLKALRARWREESAALRARQQEVQNRQKELNARRSRLVQQLPGDVLLTYERLRLRKRGIAVARLEQGICEVCGVEVPINVARKVRYGQELIFCPTCGRILVHV